MLGEILLSRPSRASRSEPQPEADLTTRPVYSPDLAPVTTHPEARPIAMGSFGPNPSAILLYHVDKPRNGIRLIQLLGVEVLAHGVGQVRGWFTRAKVGGGG